MDFIQETNTVVLFSKKYKLDALSKKIGSLSGQQIYEFFINRNVKVPRKLHVDALFSVLNLRIPELKSNDFPKENFQRLQYYSSFSETNLLKLAKSLFLPEDFEKYRQNLAKLIIINYTGLNLNDGELQYLYNLRKTSLEDFDTYSNYISSMCYEQENTFDGQEREVLFANLEDSTSVKSMQEIGEKYGIPIPSRLKKEEYLAYILDNLDNKDVSKNQEELAKMTLKQLEDFADAKNILMHPNMNKKENITYFLYTIKQFQMPCTSIKKLETLDICEPISFTVLIDKVNFFEKGTGESVIVLEGQENVLEDALDTENTTEEQQTDETKTTEEKAEEQVSEETTNLEKETVAKVVQEENTTLEATENIEKVEEPVKEDASIETTEVVNEEIVEEVSKVETEVVEEQPVVETEVVEEQPKEEVSTNTTIDDAIFEPDPETRIENDEFEAYVEVRVKKSKKEEQPKEEIKEEGKEEVEEKQNIEEASMNQEEETPIVLEENNDSTTTENEPLEENTQKREQEVDESKLVRVNSLYQTDLKESKKKKLLLALYITLGIVLIAVIAWIIYILI